MFYRFIGFCLLAGVLGCSGSEEPAAPEAPGPLEGHWLLSITQEFRPGDYRNVNTALLSIRQEEGQYKAEVKGSKPALPGAKLESFAIDGDAVHIVLTSDRYTFDFAGTVDGESVRGTMDQGGFYIEPALLTRQPIQNIADAPDSEFPKNFIEHQKLLQDALKQDAEAVSLLEHYDAFQKFCEKYPESPLSIILYHALVNAMPEKAATEADVEAFAKKYLKRAGFWGKRMETLARFNVGKSLAREPKFADLGLKYLKDAESRLDEAKREDVRSELDYYRQMAETSKSHLKAKQAYTEVIDGETESLETLRTLVDASPFDPVLMFLRAEAARRSGQFAEAMKYHARLAVWPKLQVTLQSEPIWEEGVNRKLPEGLLLELWAKEHGSDAGLEEYKLQVYDEALDLIAKQIGEPEDSAGNRVSVMELFTGTNCPPCLAADLATGALARLYPSDLIVLRYHLHTNGLDPLVNPRNFQQFETLLGPDPQGMAGTPSVFINGKPAASSISGYLDNAPPIGKSLQAELRPMLQEKTPLNLELSAYQHEDEVSVSAKLKGVPEGLRDRLQVLLLLAEADLDFPAPNGIRRHEMLVRWFFQDGSSYALPGSGDFQVATNTNLKDIRDLIDTSTRDAAIKMKAEVGTIPLELTGLKFVALVHDAQTREVLQAGVVPVNVYDTRPMQPKRPMPVLPLPDPPTGPLLIGPQVKGASDPKPAQAEKPERKGK